MQAVVWKLLLQISKNIVMVSLLPFSIFIEVLLLCGDELLFFFFFAELENRLLARFDAASQRRELSTMAECAKILSQVCIYARST